MKKDLATIIADALRQHNVDDAGFVHVDDGNLQSVMIDGCFDLVAVGKAIEEALKEEAKQ